MRGRSKEYGKFDDKGKSCSKSCGHMVIATLNATIIRQERAYEEGLPFMEK